MAHKAKRSLSLFDDDDIEEYLAQVREEREADMLHSDMKVLYPWENPSSQAKHPLTEEYLDQQIERHIQWVRARMERAKEALLK